MKENSIEEDIKIINNFITYFNKNIQNGNKADLTVLGEEINAIEHVLSDYKRVLEMNKILLKENEELKNQEATQRKINELLVQRYSNSISVQKVKDKIEELKQADKDWTEELSEPDGNFKIINRNLKRIKNQIDVLQELIEESEEK